MSSHRQLELTLARALTATVEPPGVPAILAKEIERLQQVLGGAGAGRPPKDRLREAVLQFRSSGELPNLGSARAVCFGAGDRFGTEPPLIEEPRLFRRLLDGADDYRNEPRRYRRCYRGLLHSYFLYDGEHGDTPRAGRDNWTALRDYLHDRRRHIRVEGFRPEWAETLDDHPNLLTDSPVERYGPELLDGKTDNVDRIRARLEISDASWLMRKLVLAQVVAATRESDAQFRRRVHSLLALLGKHELLQDQGLTLILDRYSAITAPEPHTDLRDRSVECWGTPWLERNTPKWSRVSKDARALVTTWLKIDLINQFFEVIAEDRGTDKRRVKFWMRYHESIHDMYFALGSNVMYSRAADVRNLRTKMGDHLLSLTDAGSPKNNAFIMLMGDLVVVEFGAKGNACFLFKRDSLPFTLRGSVRGDALHLKNPRHLERLLHMDGSEKWETKFERVLTVRGMRATNDGSRAATRLTSSAASAAEGSGSSATIRPPIAAPDRAPGLTKRAVEDLCQQYRIDYADHSSQGGNFWVFHNYNVGTVVDQLKAWGFKFTDKRGGAWWKKGLL